MGLRVSPIVIDTPLSENVGVSCGVIACINLHFLLSKQIEWSTTYFDEKNKEIQVQDFQKNKIKTWLRKFQIIFKDGPIFGHGTCVFSHKSRQRTPVFYAQKVKM